MTEPEDKVGKTIGDVLWLFWTDVKLILGIGLLLYFLSIKGCL